MGQAARSDSAGMAPWTPEQVTRLQARQDAGWLHPYTCGGTIHTRSSPSLIPTENGWRCPLHCGYTQLWAHPEDLNGTLPPNPLLVLFPGLRATDIAADLAGDGTGPVGPNRDTPSRA